MAMETVLVAETCDAGLRLQAVRRASGRLGWQIQDAAAVEATTIVRDEAEQKARRRLSWPVHRNWRDFVVAVDSITIDVAMMARACRWRPHTDRN